MTARRRLATGLGVLTAALALPLLVAAPAQAHPLGNFTVNHHTGVRVEPAAVAVRLVEDLAEIPAQQAVPSLNRGAAGEAVSRFAVAECARLARGVTVTLDGAPLTLTPGPQHAEATPGAAGLHTLRVECGLRADGIDTVAHALTVTSTNDADRLGWREIVASGDGVRLASSDVPTTSPSQVLRRYPADQLANPPDVREASLQVVRGDGVVRGDTTGESRVDGLTSALPRGLDGPARAFTDLVSRQDLGLRVGLLGALLALVLGALHAVSPGHGKTVMAAYLVGERGTLRQALTIGLTVTATHTLGVLGLGVALSTALVIAPERLYPVFGMVSGLLLVAVGLQLLKVRRRATRAVPVLVPKPALVGAPAHHDHPHPHDDQDHAHHDHPHHDHDHDQAHGDHEHEQDAGVTHSHGLGAHTHAPLPAEASWRSLVAVGLAGGLVPSPSALVVLLGAIALGRAWFGVLLVLLYGVGMAVTLTGAGIALARLRGRWAPRLAAGATGRVATLGRLLPTATAGLVVAIGAGLVLRSGLQL